MTSLNESDLLPTSAMDAAGPAGPWTLHATVPPRSGRLGPPVLRAGFDVPTGVTRIDLRLRVSAGHVVDLGLADPSFGPYPAERGFRGWSGGARASVFVARDDATPGYLPGPIAPGRWWVLLGRANIGEGGCPVRIEIQLDDAPRERAAGSPRRALDPSPDLGGPARYLGDLQTHTHHSDAHGSLDDLIIAARQRGLDFVAVTDHNTVAHHRAIASASARDGPDARPLLLPGMEITTYAGHANVWYASPREASEEPAAGWIDFRVTSDEEMRTAFTEAHRQGGLASVNHPKTQPGCIGCDWSYRVPAEADAIEAWQGPWPFGNHESLRRYDDHLRSGAAPTLVGGSDRHQPAGPDDDPACLRVGSPTTRVTAEAGTGAGILAGIAAGRVSVAEGPEGPWLEIAGDGARSDVRMGDRIAADGPLPLAAHVEGADGETLRWIGPDGVLRTVPVRGDAFDDRWTWSDPRGFVRAEVVASDPEALVERARAWAGEDPRAARHLDDAATRPWIRALSNPIHLRPAAESDTGRATGTAS